VNYKLIVALWLIFSVSIVYWDIHRWDSKEPLSVCHGSEIRIINDRPMCIECKKYCEITNENR